MNKDEASEKWCWLSAGGSVDVKCRTSDCMAWVSDNYSKCTVCGRASSIRMIGTQCTNPSCSGSFEEFEAGYCDAKPKSLEIFQN